MLMFKGKEKVKPETNAPATVEEVTPTPQQVEEHKSNFIDSAVALEEARAGRNISDIPLSDPYWMISNAHTMAHGAHAIRVDELPEQKKVRELKAKGIQVEKA